MVLTVGALMRAINVPAFAPLFRMPRTVAILVPVFGVFVVTVAVASSPLPTWRTTLAVPAVVQLFVLSQRLVSYVNEVGEVGPVMAKVTPLVVAAAVYSSVQVNWYVALGITLKVRTPPAMFSKTMSSFCQSAVNRPISGVKRAPP